MFNDDPRLVVKCNNLIHIYTKHRIASKARSDWLLKFQLSFAIHGLRSIKIVIVAGIMMKLLSVY